jgi:hypothetical protein
MREVNPRYAAYCRENAKTPTEMLAHDRKAWPGGCMCGFMLWLGEKLSSFRSRNGLGPYDSLSPTQLEEFDRELS